MEIGGSNDLLLVCVALILIALLFSRKSGGSAIAANEIQWLRRKIDLIGIQTTYILKNSGALKRPPRQVRELLEKGDDVHAIQKLREATGLSAKDAQAVVNIYKAQMSKV